MTSPLEIGAPWQKEKFLLETHPFQGPAAMLVSADGSFKESLSMYQWIFSGSGNKWYGFSPPSEGNAIYLFFFSGKKYCQLGDYILYLLVICTYHPLRSNLNDPLIYSNVRKVDVLGSSSDDKRNGDFNSQGDQQSNSTFWEGTTKGSSLEILRMGDEWWVMSDDEKPGFLWDHQHPCIIRYMIYMWWLQTGRIHLRFNWKFL